MRRKDDAPYDGNRGTRERVGIKIMKMMIGSEWGCRYDGNNDINYQPIVVTAILQRPVALLYQWSPTLESILVRQLMIENALLQFKPTLDQAKRSLDYIKKYMPLKVGVLNNKVEQEWYWQCSSPCVKLTAEDKLEYKKYWDTKDFYPERITTKLTWFVVAHTDGLLNLLNRIHSIGKVKTNTYSPVLEWVVKEVDYDWHLWRSLGTGANKRYYLNKPIPIRFFSKNRAIPDTQLIMHWGWKAPENFEFNQDRCYMPNKNILTSIAPTPRPVPSYSVPD